MSEFENIRAIKNFINVSKGRKSFPINNRNLPYRSNLNDKKRNKKRICERESRRYKQVKRREKAWKEFCGEGIFARLQGFEFFQDPNIEITKKAKQKRQENRIIHRKNKKFEKNQNQLIKKCPMLFFKY